MNILEARKLIIRFIKDSPGNVVISEHAENAAKDDNMNNGHIWNVLSSSSSRILFEAEFEKGSYRYRLQTSKMVVVVCFSQMGDIMIVVSCWRL
jgi:hypothetical protein